MIHSQETDGVDPNVMIARHSLAPVVIQALLVFGSVALLPMAPPVSGRMLLVPLGGEASIALPRLAINAGARLVEHGPWTGSFIVEGRRDALLPILISHHILMLGALGGGCNGRKVGL